jgi:riboflavin kinase
MVKEMKNSQNEIMDYLNLLIQIGKMGGARRPISCTTKELGNFLGMSQQTTSRKLTKMENNNLIIRNYTNRGNSIKISSEGILFLEQIYTDLWMILVSDQDDTKEEIILQGKVCTGMGEGAYYMSRKGYRNQFPTLVGPGTLNIQLLDESSLSNLDRLQRNPAKFIKEFMEDERKFGRVFVWPVFLIIKSKKIPSALIRPDRTHHSHQIELIAKENIKKEYNIKDGDILQVTTR